MPYERIWGGCIEAALATLPCPMTRQNMVSLSSSAYKYWEAEKKRGGGWEIEVRIDWDIEGEREERMKENKEKENREIVFETKEKTIEKQREREEITEKSRGKKRKNRGGGNLEEIIEEINEKTERGN